MNLSPTVHNVILVAILLIAALLLIDAFEPDFLGPR